jgi:hypothetical protein
VAQKSSFLGEKSVKWVSVQSGVWVLRLWSGKQYPQVAVFQFTADAYKKVRENLSDFLNKAEIFGKGVKVQDHSGPGVVMVNPGPQQGNGVFLMVTHGKPSRSAWVLLSGDPAPEAPEWEIHPRGPSLPSL